MLRIKRMMGYSFSMVLFALLFGPFGAEGAFSGNPVEGNANRSIFGEEDISGFIKECESGDAQSCSDVGVIRNSEGDPKAAVGYFQKSCDGGAGQGCRLLGQHYENGAGVEANLARAIACYRKACDLGDPEGCKMLADMYYLGRGTEKDAKKAIRYFRKACDSDVGLACYYCGEISFKDKKEGKAAEYWLKALELCRGECEKSSKPEGRKLQISRDGDSEYRLYVSNMSMRETCLGLSRIYHYAYNNPNLHRSIPPDPGMEERYLSFACDLGSVDAQYSLGTLYMNGSDGIKRNSAKAEDLLRKACDSEIAEGCCNLGNFLKSQGKKAEALEKWAKGCELGDPYACLNSGQMLTWKPQEEADFSRGIAYLKRAAELGMADGFYIIGLAYRKHPSFAPNPEAAREYFEKACKAGVRKACDDL